MEGGGYASHDVKVTGRICECTKSWSGTLVGKTGVPRMSNFSDSSMALSVTSTWACAARRLLDSENAQPVRLDIGNCEQTEWRKVDNNDCE